MKLATLAWVYIYSKSMNAIKFYVNMQFAYFPSKAFLFYSVPHSIQHRPLVGWVGYVCCSYNGISPVFCPWYRPLDVQPFLVSSWSQGYRHLEDTQAIINYDSFSLWKMTGTKINFDMLLIAKTTHVLNAILYINKI